MKKNHDNIALLEKRLFELNSENEKLREQLHFENQITATLNSSDTQSIEILNKIPFPVIAARFSEAKPGRIFFANRAFLDFSAAKKEDVLNKLPSRFFKKRENPHIPFFSENSWRKLRENKSIELYAKFNFNGVSKNVNVIATIVEGITRDFLLISLKDLTKEIKYLTEIQEKEKRYKSFMDNSESAIFRISFPHPISLKLPKKRQAELIYNTGEVLECNKVFADNWGFGDPDLLVGRKINFLFGSIENPVNSRTVKEFIKNNYVIRNKIIKRVSVQSGEDVFLSMNGFGVIEENKLTQVWGIYYDVTKLEKIKQSLQKSRDEFRQLFEQAPVPMSLIDEQMRTVSFNKAMIKRFGYTVEDLPTLNDWYEKALKHNGSAKRIAKYWGALALKEQKNNFINRETTILTKDGELRNVLVSFKRIGEKYLISLHDVTDAYKARERAERAKKIIENSSTILLQWEFSNNRFKLIYITENISQFGYSSKEIVNGEKRFRSLIVREDERKIFEERKKAVEGKRRKLRQIYRLVTNSGEERFFESNISIVREKGKIAFWEVISDVTDKHIAEIKLRESIEKYRSVFENSPIGIFHYDNKGIIIGFNEQFVKSLNSTRKKLQGFNLLKDLKNKDVLRLVRNSLQGKAGIYEGEYTSVTSGKSLYVRLRVQPIFDENRKVSSVVGLWEDISERIIARQQLEKTRDEFRKTAEQLDFILNHLNDIVYEQNKNKDLVFVSGSVRNVLGYAPTEFMLRRKQIVTDNPINDKVDYYLDQVLKKRKTVRYYVEMIAKNKRKVLLEVNESPIVSNGKITGLIGVARDVTDSYKNQLIQKTIHDIAVKTYEAQSLNDLYKFIHVAIAQFMPAENIFIAILDPVKNLLSFQYYVDETDTEAPDPITPRNGFTEFVIANRKNRIYKKSELLQLIKEGKFKLIGELPESVAVAYLKFSDGKKGVIVLQDYNNPEAYDDDDIQFLKFVSTQIIQSIEKKKAEEELRAANRMLRKTERELRKQAEELQILNANKDKLFSIIAHDLRSPFTALLGLSNMLNEMIDDMTIDEIKELVASLNNSATNLFKLLENLLNWSRIQLGSFKILPEKFLLYDVAFSVVNYLHAPASQKEISLFNKVPEDLMVYADKPTVETIIRNLVNNAIKFTNTGGNVSVEARIKTDTTVEVSIIDDGIGMSPELVGKLFQIDKKVSRPGTANEVGTGLGLVLVKELVEKNGGEIRVESEENKGSSFIFTLPSAR